MEITREQLEQIIREEIEEGLPAGERTFKTGRKGWDRLQAQACDAEWRELIQKGIKHASPEWMEQHKKCGPPPVGGRRVDQWRPGVDAAENLPAIPKTRRHGYGAPQRTGRFESKMNITKEELARIIKEETSAVLESWKDYPSDEYDAKIKARVQAYNKQFEEVTKTINDLEKESPAAAIKTAGDFLKTGVGGNHELIDWLKTKVEDLRDDWQTRHFSEEKIYQEGILDRLKGALGSEPVGHGGWTKGERKAVTALLLKAFEKYSADDSPQRSADLAKAVGNALHSLHTRDLLDPLKLQDVLNAIAKKDNVLKTSGEENAAAVSDRIRAGAFPAP